MSFAAELVPGDVIEVVVGGKVPADARVVELLSTTLRIDQASGAMRCWRHGATAADLAGRIAVSSRAAAAAVL